jgi:pimeloyl-ACP methyl ester carboxylesterase
MPSVDNKGISIHYRVEGNGPPLVLVHGMTDSSETWYERGYVAALKPKYHLVLIDARGHGQSDKPHDPQYYTSEKVVSDIVGVLDNLGIKTVAYWGYAMEGRQGFALARRAMDRVACFVIGASSASTASAYPAEPGKEGPLITAFRGGPSEVIKLYGEEWMTPPLRERLKANDMAALIACQQQSPLNAEGLSDVKNRIAVPTLLYAGTADPIHDAARQTASEIAGAQFVSIPGMSHIAAMARSDLVLPYVEPFLAKAIGHRVPEAV